MWAGFFCRQDVSISIFGRTKEFSEVRGTSLMCNFGVHSRFLDVIYGVRPPNGSPVTKKTQPHIAYQSLYLIIFSFSPMKISAADFSVPIGARVFNFCVHLQVGYCVNENAKAHFALFFNFPSVTPI